MGGGPAPGGAERDELTALQSIFGGDLRRGDRPGWWALRVQPHPGELEANHVACELSFRYPDAGYPDAPPRFRLEQVAGAERGELPRWLERVEAEAAAAAAQGSVCVFDAASLLQELLQEANEPEEEPASLWEDMQQREREGPGGAETALPAGPDFSGFRCEPPMLDDDPLDAAGGGRGRVGDRGPGLGAGWVGLGGGQPGTGGLRGSPSTEWTRDLTWREDSAKRPPPRSRSHTFRNPPRQRSSPRWSLKCERVSRDWGPPSPRCCPAG